ncbi:HAD-IIIA family hydrolase [Candidatus Pacearchaeota archaeon]|nr:HAD-IIIA family hydrolase [Candidatus Pacearchaeota archaeon]
MTILVCLDRDGTINKDENYFLGSTEDWKSKVKFLPGVVKGIKLLNQISDLEVFIITNQAGVALENDEFKALTEQRYQEVNEYIIQELAKKQAIIRGFFGCPYVDLKYAEKSRQRGRTIDSKYLIDNHPDWKPNPGMVEKAAKSLGKNLRECRVYFIGDRLTDVKTGLNAGGTGILVSRFKTRELGDEEKVQKLKLQYPNRVYIAKNFLEAVRIIKKDLESEPPCVKSTWNL